MTSCRLQSVDVIIMLFVHIVSYIVMFILSHVVDKPCRIVVIVDQ